MRIRLFLTGSVHTCAGALGGQNSLEPELRRQQAAQQGYWEANSGSPESSHLTKFHEVLKAHQP